VALYVFEKFLAFWYPLLLQAEKDLSVWGLGTIWGTARYVREWIDLDERVRLFYEGSIIYRVYLSGLISFLFGAFCLFLPYHGAILRVRLVSC
jgi:hypothetical protein